MFDGLFDLLDRDRSHRSSSSQSPGGLRGLVARLSGEHEDDEYDRRPRHDRQPHGDEEDDRDELLNDRPSRRRRQHVDWLDD